MKQSFVRRVYQTMLCAATIISPELNGKISFLVKYGRLPDLRHPKTFHEKLLYLKLRQYNSSELVKRCADKLAVRDYVQECGCGEYLNVLICVFNDAREIVFSKLPDQFALKWTFGAGYNIICGDKSKLNENIVKRQMEKWGRKKYYLYNAELQYKDTDTKIICEKFLGGQSGKRPDDYKLYCFNGKVRTILAMTGRGETMNTVFLSPAWQVIGYTEKYRKMDTVPPKPKRLEEMLRLAEQLAKPFPFVRVDLYVVNDDIYFGEMTFTPAGGVYTSEIDINGKSMGEFLDVVDIGATK